LEGSWVNHRAQFLKPDNALAYDAPLMECY